MKRMLDQKMIDLIKTLSPEQIAWVNEIKGKLHIEDIDGTEYVACSFLQVQDTIMCDIGAFVDDDDNQIFPNGVPTKLYKHDIVVNDHGEDQDRLILITASSTSINTPELIGNVLNNMNYVSSFVISVNYGNGIASYGDTSYLVYFDFSEKVEMNIQYGETITDTITPL